MRERRRITWIPPALLFIVACAAEGQAAPWDLTAGASVTQAWTDNVGLDAPGAEEDEHITSARVGATLSRQRATSRASLAYSLVGVHYWNDSRTDDYYHQFEGSGETELVREHLFLEAGATYEQRLTSTQGAVPLDLLTPSRNRADVATWRISPRYEERLGRLAFLSASYGWQRTDYVGSGLDNFDSDAHRVRASLASGSLFRRIGWNVDYRREEIDFGDGSEVVFDILEGLLRWNMSRDFSVYAAGGRERNDFEFSPDRRPRPDDDFWRAGITWSPTVRSSLDLYYGERFFGETYGASFRHRSRSANWFLDYNESPTTLSSIELVPAIGIIETPTGEIFLIELEIPELVTDVYISRRFTAGVSGARTRTRWSIRLFQDRREYQSRPEADQRASGVALNSSLRLVAHSELGLSARWQRNDFEALGREDDLWMIEAGFTKGLSRRTDASLRLRHQERSSSAAGADYRENRITATLSTRF